MADIDTVRVFASTSRDNMELLTLDVDGSDGDVSRPASLRSTATFQSWMRNNDPSSVAETESSGARTAAEPPSDGDACGPCTGAAHGRVTDFYAKPQDGIFWPSSKKSAWVLMVLHLGASPLILAPALSWKYDFIPFYITVVFVIVFSSFPLHILEWFIGHYCRASISESLACMAPILRALGYSLLMLVILLSIHYTEFVAWVLIYLHYVVQFNFPWSGCRPDYNSKFCFSNQLQEQCKNSTVYHDFGCLSATDFCRSNGFIDSNGSHCWHRQLPDARLLHSKQHSEAAPHRAVPLHETTRRAPSDVDFFRSFLSGSEWNDMGLDARRHHQAAISIAYAMEWLLLLLLCMTMKMTSNLAKYAAYTSPVFLFIVMVRVLFLPGAVAEVSRRLFTFTAGHAAGVKQLQMFGDVVFMVHTGAAVGSGVVATVASRDRLPHSRTTKPSAISASFNHFMSLIVSITLFAIEGYLQAEHGVNYSDVYASPSEKVLVPLAALSHALRFGDLYVALFLTTVLVHSLASLSAVMSSLALNVRDCLPYFRRRPVFLTSMAVISLTCALGFLLVGLTWAGIRLAVHHLLTIQWAIGLCLLSVTLSLKVAAHSRRLAELHDLLGPLTRPLRMCCLLGVPLAALLAALSSGSQVTAPGGASAAQVLGYSALLLPPMTAAATAVYLSLRRTAPLRSLVQEQQPPQSKQQGEKSVHNAELPEIQVILEELQG